MNILFLECVNLRDDIIGCEYMIVYMYNIWFCGLLSCVYFFNIVRKWKSGGKYEE